MTTRVAIDPNVRVRGQLTYSGFEDVVGTIAVGQTVEVFEPESGLVGFGRITEIDLETALVYLGVDWSTLRVSQPAASVGDSGATGPNFSIVVTAARGTATVGSLPATPEAAAKVLTFGPTKSRVSNEHFWVGADAFGLAAAV